MNSGDPAEGIRLGSKLPYLLSYVASPIFPNKMTECMHLQQRLPQMSKGNWKSCGHQEQLDLARVWGNKGMASLTNNLGMVLLEKQPS